MEELTAKEAATQLLKQSDSETILRCLREMDKHEEERSDMKKTALADAAPKTTLEK